MKTTTKLFAILLTGFLAGCQSFPPGQDGTAPAGDYPDLARVDTVIPGQVYRLSDSGIRGAVESDHIRVIAVIPGSPADGKILKGDKIVLLQHRGLGSDIRAMVAKRVYRLGRDWDWHFFVTVERASLRGGKGNRVTFDLRMPPAPGNLCHCGPAGFFAKRHPGHLVVEVVEKGSPADGKLQTGDVILAVDGQPVTLDAYNLFTQAIDKAESEEGGGELTLTVQRGTAFEAGAQMGEDDAGKGTNKAPTAAEASANKRGENSFSSAADTCFSHPPAQGAGNIQSDRSDQLLQNRRAHHPGRRLPN